jgi:hypothetical protein
MFKDLSDLASPRRTRRGACFASLRGRTGRLPSAETVLEFDLVPDERQSARALIKPFYAGMRIFAKIRQVYNRLCGRKEASADRMHQERAAKSRPGKTYERERQIAAERDSKQLGAHWGPF